MVRAITEKKGLGIKSATVAAIIAPKLKAAVNVLALIVPAMDNQKVTVATNPFKYLGKTFPVLNQTPGH
jgi:hypothetical protein